MRKFIVKTFLFLFALYLVHSIFYISPTFAAEPTPIASMSADLRQKLKILQDEIASKAAKLKQEVSKKLQNKVYFGVLKSKSDNSLTLATQAGSKIVNLNDFTQYSGFEKTKVSLKSLNSEDHVAALGDIDDNDVLTAKMILKYTPPQTEKQIVSGKVISIEDEEIVIRTKDNKNYSFSVTDGTTYQLGNDEAQLKDIKPNDTIISVVESSQKKAAQARFIYIFPQSQTVKSKPASPSATPKN